MKKAKSCGGVVFWQGKEIKYLILLHREGHWDFPKGLVEKEESEIQTALREIKEETGLSIVILTKKLNRIHYFYKYKNQLISKEVVFFLVEAKNKKVRISEEHTDYKWLAFPEAFALLKFPNQRKTITKAHTYLYNEK